MEFKKEKEIIINALTTKKNEEIARFDKIEQNVINANNPIDLYMTLVEIYGNTKEQAEISIEFIRKIFNNKFFKNASAKINANSIEFSHNDLRISFSTSKNFEINIYNDNHHKIPEKPKMLSENFMREYSLGKQYLANHKKETLKEYIVTRLYNQKRTTERFFKNLSFIDKFKINKYTRYYTLNIIEEDIKEKEILISKEKEEQKKYSKELKEYEKREEEINGIVNAMKLFETFKKKGWRIRFNNGLEKPFWAKEELPFD